MTLNGAMTGDSFRSYIAQVLGPTLRRGDIARYRGASRG